MTNIASPTLTGDAVSVVIIGRNEGPRLDACIRSVLAARWPSRLELIYVDSGSTDGSKQTATALGAAVCVIEPPFSAAAARNAGWARASAAWLLFLDGDTVLDPEFPAQALAALHAEPYAACAWGHRRESAPHQSLYTRALDLDWIFPIGQTDFCGGDALFKRIALEQSGGFDATLIAGEEPELCSRLRALGWTIRHIDAPMTKHDLGIRRFAQYWKRCERAGHAYAAVSGRKTSADSPALWRTESRRNLVHAACLALLAVAPVLALVLGLTSAGAIAACSALLLAVAIGRTTLRHRWKTDSGFDALVYGVHSHLQQLPIVVGQLRHWFGRARAPRRLIEYR